MRDFEKQITEWRHSMRPKIASETLEELENHLRETLDSLLAQGVSPEAAFAQALRRLGSTGQIASEFEKVDEKLWWPLKAAIGAFICAAVATPIFLLLFTVQKPLGWLLTAHTLTITLGYLSGFLISGVGICYVCRRSAAEFSAAQLRSLANAISIFAGAAAALTCIGIGLAMIWAKLSWGRYWDWDAKEIGGLCVLTWFLLIIFLWRRNLISAHAYMLLAIAAGIVVTLGWFGANAIINAGLFQHKAQLAAMLAPQIFFLVMGCLPPEWARRAVRQR